MDQELISYLDKRFGEVDKRFGEMNKRFDAVDQHFALVESDVKELRKETHETRILLEALRGDVQMVAEGVAAGFDEGLQPLRSDVAAQLEDMRKLHHVSQSDLHSRVRVLEAWKERTASDPIALIRERFGLNKPKG